MTVPGLTAASVSDVGCKRKNNEDSLLSLPEFGLFVVADGMGGAREGHVASKALTDTLGAEFKAKNAGTLGFAAKSQLVHTVINQVNLWIRNRAEEHGFAQMGSTLVTAIFDFKYRSRGLALHAGDSRFYRFRKGILTQITTDHSYAALLAAESGVARDENSLPPGMRGIVTNAVGRLGQSDARLTVDLTKTPFDVVDEDLFIVCSDGLTRMVPDDKLAKLLGKHRSDSALRLAEILVEAAKQAGGADNISVVLVKVDPGFVAAGCAGVPEPDTETSVEMQGSPQASHTAAAPVVVQPIRDEGDTPTPTDQGTGRPEAVVEDLGAAMKQELRKGAGMKWGGILGISAICAVSAYLFIKPGGGEKLTHHELAGVPPVSKTAVAMPVSGTGSLPAKPVAGTPPKPPAVASVRPPEVKPPPVVPPVKPPAVPPLLVAQVKPEPPPAVAPPVVVKPPAAVIPPAVVATPTNAVAVVAVPKPPPVQVVVTKPAVVVEPVKVDPPEVVEAREREAAGKLLASGVGGTFRSGKWGDLKKGLGVWAYRLPRIEADAGKRATLQVWMDLWDDCATNKNLATRAKGLDDALQGLAGDLGVKLPELKVPGGGDAAARADAYCSMVYDRQVQVLKAVGNFVSAQERQLSSLGNNLLGQGNKLFLWKLLADEASVSACGRVCGKVVEAKKLCGEFREWAVSGLADHRPVAWDGRKAKICKILSVGDDAFEALFRLIEPVPQQFMSVENCLDGESGVDVLNQLRALHPEIMRSHKKHTSVREWRDNGGAEEILKFLTLVDALARSLRTDVTQ